MFKNDRLTTAARAVIGATVISGFALGFILPEIANDSRVELQVTSATGELYIAGAGSDCPAAWHGADFTENGMLIAWRSIECVETR